MTMDDELARARKDLQILRRIWTRQGLFDENDDPFEHNYHGSTLARLFGAELPLTEPGRTARITAAATACQMVADLARHHHMLQCDRDDDALPWGNREHIELPTVDECKADAVIEVLGRALDNLPKRGFAILPLELPPWIDEDIAAAPTCRCASSQCCEHVGRRIVFLFDASLRVHTARCAAMAQSSKAIQSRAPSLDAADEVADCIAAMSDAAPLQ
jgi:hypothetical protein